MGKLTISYWSFNFFREKPMVAWNPNRLWNPWSSEFLGCRWEPQKIKPQSLMVNDVNTQPFLVILGCFLMEFTGTKNNSRPLPVRQCADSVFRVFCAKPQGLPSWRVLELSDTPTIGIEVGCSVSLRDGFHLGRVQVFWISHLIAHFAVFPEAPDIFTKTANQCIRRRSSDRA